jgi:hypothetical protein
MILKDHKRSFKIILKGPSIHPSFSVLPSLPHREGRSSSGILIKFVRTSRGAQPAGPGVDKAITNDFNFIVKGNKADIFGQANVFVGQL